MPNLIPAQEVKIQLQALTGWAVHPDHPAIVKQFEFKNFSHAFAWMTQIALLAERLNHHPDWQNVYQKVKVILTTHDAGGITELDIKMATSMNNYAKLYLA